MLNTDYKYKNQNTMETQKTDYPQNCPTCNASLMGRWEYITKGHIKLLNKLHLAVKHYGRNSIHLQEDMNLTKNEYNNFQKLRYNGLIAHASRSGNWLITRRGAQFLQQKISLPKGVLIFRNRIQRYHSDQVTVSSILNGATPYYYHKSEFDYEVVDKVDFSLDRFNSIRFDLQGQGIIDFDNLV